MLTPKLTELRVQIKTGTKQAAQKELLAELNHLELFLGKIEKASTKQEIVAATALLKDSIQLQNFSSITSGAGGICPCCGRKL